MSTSISAGGQQAPPDPSDDGFRRYFGRRPTIGAAAAAKQVATDASALVKAEIELAKAEVTASLQAKATGAGLFVAAGVAGWLALQGLLITAGLALALVLPGWAAALIVTAVLLLVAAVAALIGRRKLATPVKLETTKQNVEEDVEWAKAHLPRR